MHNQWIKINWNNPDTLPSSGRVEAFTPSTDLVLRHRFFDSNLFKQAAKDATHWRYVSDPTTSNAIPLHSFDEEPTLDPDQTIYIHVIVSDFERKVIECIGKDSYWSGKKSRPFTWKEQADWWRPIAKGWLYDFELMQCVKNGTRSE